MCFRFVALPIRRSDRAAAAATFFPFPKSAARAAPSFLKQASPSVLAPMFFKTYCLIILFLSDFDTFRPFLLSDYDTIYPARRLFSIRYCVSYSYSNFYKQKAPRSGCSSLYDYKRGQCHALNFLIQFATELPKIYVSWRSPPPAITERMICSFARITAFRAFEARL